MPDGPPCAAAAPWWRDAVVYQVYPRSFADADGNGIREMPGGGQELTFQIGRAHV